MEKEKKQIRFSDLSGDLKTLVVIMWIYSGLIVLAFLAGFFSALLK